jgi:hypothetical protein
MAYGEVYKILDAMLKHYRRETRTSQQMGADARELSAYIAWVLEKINTIRSTAPMERDIENAYAISCYMSRIKMRHAEYIKNRNSR